MEKFFDAVKIKFNGNLDSYFKDVEVESIKRNKNTNTLNFYLVSYNLIRREIIKNAEIDMANQLLNIDIKTMQEHNGFFNNPIKLIVKYKLSDIYTSKIIFEEIKRDLFYELKESKMLYSAFFRNDNVHFINDNTMELSLIESKEFEDAQNELIKMIDSIFKNRYGRDIVIKRKKVKSDVSDFENKTIRKSDIIKNEDVDIKKDDISIENIDTKKKSIYKKGIQNEGDILYGIKKSRAKVNYVSISNIVYDLDNIETKGVIYNLKARTTKNGDKMLFSVFIYDGESCIEIKFFDEIEKESLFYSRFKIGTEIKIIGNAKYDSTFSKAFVFGPIGIQYIEEVGKREVIEFGKPGDEDYHNILITDRDDDELEKRVELHLHTKSSMQDGVGEVKAYIDTATKFGMKAMAITDHGCVNALADAYEYLNDKKRPRKNNDFKIIYGMEGYLVDDYENYYIDKNGFISNKSYNISNSFVIFELTLTGKNRINDAIIKIEAVKISKDYGNEYFSEFVNTNHIIDIDIRDATGVKESDIQSADDLKSVLKRFVEFVDDSVLVTSNIDTNWLITNILKENGFDDDYQLIDLSVLSRILLKNLKTSDLISIAKELKIKIEGITDRKKNEIRLSLKSFEKIKLEENIFPMLKNILINEYEIKDLSELKDKLKISDDFIMRQPYYHIILLAKNDVGRVNLYKLVSDSSIKYMYKKRPRIPRSLITTYREGLIVGSACILGEFMNAIKDGASDIRLKEIASFYDYLEIQPTLNNSFLLKNDNNNFKSIADLENLNKKVVKIGEELDKLVVATCDCHYVDKTDKIYRDILRFGSTFKKSNFDANGKLKLDVSEGLESSSNEELYFRTTKEMLNEFSYLGIDKAKEVVIKNTNIINNMIENIVPLRKDKCPPYIEGSDDELIKTCLNNYKKIFGDKSSNDIKVRLDNELKYIIDNGYSVMYIAAKKLIDFSNEHGFPVGSRGSVGSSLAATLLGISEVNPLKPYYVCPKCHKLIYDTDETNKYINDTGFDMPDKFCPVCNEKMIKDGVNIPFETFLGIPGDIAAQKEPDIDLNFCSVFQSNVHRETISLFGPKNTFKAGTVGTVAKKTAYGYVKKYSEAENKDFSNELINFHLNRILDCKNNTGQHPGGMVVVPEGEEIYTFTPIQLAADKVGNDVTTHYDYHKIDKNLLKLDLLGHDSPLMLKKLAEITGVDFMSVPFYEKMVLKLFESTESLGITPNDISGTRLGCLTIPEFGTDFAMNMCEEAKPKTVADLIRIAGLAHGTNVWQGNVQDLIKNGDCTLSSAICCRDDIMIYLIEKGLDKGLSFNIMESVRKGKGLKGEWIDEMKAHDVPDWYIECCKKIQYMFPKAHAAAYVLASLRIAYYKVHFPKEYYATYFSIKKDGLDYRLMLQNKEDISYHIAKIKKIINERSNDANFKNQIKNQEKQYSSSLQDKSIDNFDADKEKNDDLYDEETLLTQKYEKMSAKNLFDLYMVYRIVEEMKSRGIDFCPIDIYKAKRSDFQVVDGCIMPSFDSIPGIGIKEDDIDYDENKPISEKSTAMKCELEAKKGEYSSIENFSKRTGVNKTIIEEMKKLGLFNGMKENDQNKVFDYL